MNKIILKLLTGNNKYSKKTAYFSSKLEDLNKQFLEMLKMLGVTKVNMTTLGNSIATGYSVSDIIKPLLLRNASLKDLLNKNGIEADYYNFTRSQDNNEEKLLEWIYGNIKQSEMNRRNHVDFQDGPNSMDRSGITDEEVQQYFPLNPKKDKGLYDLIMEKENDLANILVYSGCTGSFLDNFSRHGLHLNLYGFKRDLIGLESVLKMTYIKNPHTQIYVTGIPNLLNINIVNIINSQIKAICKKYANATYVKPAPAHMFYDKNGKLVCDIHHNQCEYLNLNSNIMGSIVNNYIQNMFNIELDESLSKLSDKNQYDTPELKNDATVVEDQVNKLVTKYTPLFEMQGKNIDGALNKFVKYYKERYPHDYYYTPRSETIDILKSKS